MTRSHEDCVVVLEGEWDLARRQELSRLVEDTVTACPQTAAVVVDLRATTFIDSSVLAILVSLYSRLRAEGRRLITLCGTGGAALRTIELLNLGDQLGVVRSDPSEENDAVA